MDRYNHDLGDDTDDTDDSPLFGSFSSYSPQSRKISQTRPPQLNPDAETDASSRKHPFRAELESTIAQMSLGSDASTVTPPFKSTDQPSERHRPPVSTTVKNNSSCVENQNRTDKSNATTASSCNITYPASAISSSNESQLTIVKNTRTEGTSINPSTPDSSQTESDDVSPQIQRKRHTHSRDKLPRFSISVDDEHM